MLGKPQWSFLLPKQKKDRNQKIYDPSFVYVGLVGQVNSSLLFSESESVISLSN